jgi:hypothetical protein
MKVEINGNEYKLKLDLRARLKLRKYYTDETEMFTKAGEKDFGTITRIIHASLKNYPYTYEYFLQNYPNVKETYEALQKLFQKLIGEAGNPFELENKANTQAESREPVKTNFRELIITLMSKGYTQEEVLNMSYWDINLIFEADYKKLEREVIHTNAIINTMAGIMGNKTTIDILGREKKQEYRDYSMFAKVSKLLDKNR